MDIFESSLVPASRAILASVSEPRTLIPIHLRMHTLFIRARSFGLIVEAYKQEEPHALG